jgi:hypothetical protein
LTNIILYVRITIGGIMKLKLYIADDMWLITEDMDFDIEKLNKFKELELREEASGKLPYESPICLKITKWEVINE